MAFEEFLINNTSVTLSVLPTSRLGTSPLHPLLYPLINTAFSVSHESSKGSFLPAANMRLKTTTQIIDEIGPAAFTYVLHTPLPHSNNDPSAINVRVFATASAKPFTGVAVPVGTATSRTFKRAPPTTQDPNIDQWELLLMAVDPAIQGQGLASKLMKSVEEDLLRRWRLEQNATQHEEREKQLWLLLTTLKEINFDWYLRRGYVWTGERYFPPGEHGSKDGFTVVEMEKRLA